jgi:hypothetical protein
MQHLMIKVILFLVLYLPFSSFSMSVQYFGLVNQLPVQRTKSATVCLLDKGEAINLDMNQDLREQMAIHPMCPAEIRRRYLAQFKGLSRRVICQFEAAKLGVTQLPAIVINHQYVIYGQQNIDSGVNEYQAFLERDHVA